MRRLGWLGLLVACAGGGGGKDGTPTGTPAGSGTAGCPGIVSSSLRKGELALDGVIDVELSGAGEVFAVCGLDGDPEEEILVESDGPAATHSLHVTGMAADSSYSCELRTTCGGAASAVDFAVQTDPIVNHDGWTVATDGTGMQGVWTLFNDQAACGPSPLTRLFIIDPEGRVRWSYGVGTGYVIDIDASYIGDGVVHMGGGWGLFEDTPHRGLMRQIDLAGNTLIERTLPDFGLGFNHHSEVLDDGTVLGLTTSLDTDGVSEWFGVAIEVWDPTSMDVTWSWSSQQLYDDGTFPAQTEESPWHANSVTFHDDALGSAAWISLYYGKMIWRVDRATGALTHQFGPGGDFALTDVGGAALGDAEYPWVSHDPDYDGDKVLLYDNGVDRPGGNYSRVAEYQLDLATNEATLLWSWTEPGWYEPVIGDADYLDNGNVLITRGHVWCFDFTPGHSAIIELEPGTEREVWRIDYNTQASGIFRSERYEGCEIFDNAKYCPAVRDRIDALRSQ